MVRLVMVSFPSWSSSVPPFNLVDDRPQHLDHPVRLVEPLAQFLVLSGPAPGRRRGGLLPLLIFPIGRRRVIGSASGRVRSGRFGMGRDRNGEAGT
jgi:hypothetical protein